MDGSFDRDGAVADHIQFHASGNSALQFRDFRADLADDIDHIGAGLALDIDDDGRRALKPATGAVVLQSIDDIGDVADRDRRAVAVGDDDGLVGVRGRDLVVGGNRIGLLRAVERSLRPRDVGAGDRVA